MITLAKRDNIVGIAKLVTLAVTVMVLLAGCESYLSGTSRTVGELTDDTAIQARVKSKLISAWDVNGLFMNVEVKKGVVTLVGRIKSEEVRRRAVEIAESVKGVVRVEDRLRLRAKRGSGDRS